VWRVFPVNLANGDYPGSSAAEVQLSAVFARQLYEFPAGERLHPGNLNFEFRPQVGCLKVFLVQR